MDSTGVEPDYVLRSSSLFRRLVTGCFAATTGSATFRVWEGRHDLAGVVLGLVLVLIGAVLVLILLTRPSAIAFSADGVRIRSFLRFGPLVPWSEVVEVEVAGRWDDEPSIRLPIEGYVRRRSLRGMPEEDVRRLAGAFARSRGC
ncbi:hypothetical protein FHR75_004164 [Kineococcus radiotolerans]|uniref:PH domain-containing protein n=1 Tax=Kineococcus radiotolerans TaxID=131568 RepID=A0A7W4TQR6_KINRA|nr:hypothetical protein [Kineococcus radiotolerans]MBB2903322.1 hypothetical protein [Kineococcus radiotolerans]